MDPTTRNAETRTETQTLYMALELGGSKWVLVSGLAPNKIRTKVVDAGDLSGLREELGRARKRFGLAEDAPVKSCYEAGRDGFWIHRALLKMGVQSIVVDSASIEVSRRKRRVKTDRIDGKKLHQQLFRFDHGEKDALSVVNVPSESDEDLRRIHRERGRLKKERTSLVNRIRGQLNTQGIFLRSLQGLRAKLPELRCWDGQPLPPHLRDELGRSCERLETLQAHLRQVEGTQRRLLDSSKDKSVEKVRMMASLRGVGCCSAWVLVGEFFGWREFRNRRQVGAAAGLTGSPYSSDGCQTEQGISKAGNVRLRTLMVELAWLWLRYQPDSALSKWFHDRWSSGAKRNRRVGIVALARKLLVALWRFVDFGEVPDGARLKVAA